ncbi:MAG TPA: hypothetical protein VIJ04_05775 [Xanthobacteraceae bacterium]
MRILKFLSAMAVVVLSTGASGQTYQDLSAMVHGPWHHVPDARSMLAFNREMARCQVVAAQMPVNSTTPAVIEIVHWRVLINCLKASGYELGPAVAHNIAPRKFAPAVAGKGPGISPCSQYNASLGNEKEEFVFYSWADGFLTGYNVRSGNGQMVELSALSDRQQLKFVRDFCAEHPDKRYVEAVLALIQALRESTAGK